MSDMYAYYYVVVKIVWVFIAWISLEIHLRGNFASILMVFMAQAHAGQRGGGGMVKCRDS